MKSEKQAWVPCLHSHPTPSNILTGWDIKLDQKTSSWRAKCRHESLTCHHIRHLPNTLTGWDIRLVRTTSSWRANCRHQSQTRHHIRHLPTPLPNETSDLTRRHHHEEWTAGISLIPAITSDTCQHLNRMRHYYEERNAGMSPLPALTSDTCQHLSRMRHQTWPEDIIMKSEMQAWVPYLPSHPTPVNILTG